MRIYALYGRNVKILGYMLGSATILAIVAAVGLLGVSYHYANDLHLLLFTVVPFRAKKYYSHLWVSYWQ